MLLTFRRRISASYRTVQNRYSVLYHEPEAEVFDVCESRGVGFLPFSLLSQAPHRKGQR